MTVTTHQQQLVVSDWSSWDDQLKQGSPRSEFLNISLQSEQCTESEQNIYCVEWKLNNCNSRWVFWQKQHGSTIDIHFCVHPTQPNPLL